jgi:hypothetical protein
MGKGFTPHPVKPTTGVYHASMPANQTNEKLVEKVSFTFMNHYHLSDFLL